jgi:LPXTG-motif cell wall-anchored protein
MMVVYKETSKYIKIFFTGLVLFVSMIHFSSVNVLAEDLDKSEVGIQFEKTIDSSDEPTPKDNTPKPKDGNEAKIKKLNLPNTGELIKNLSLLVGMMILIATVFVFILDKKSDLDQK